MASKLVQIYYEDSQKVHCYPFADLYFNPSLTIYFENAVIKDVVLATEADKIAVCSWKLREKMRYYIGRPRPLTLEVLNSDYQVLSMTKNTKIHQTLKSADRWHPGFMKTFDKMIGKCGLTRPNEIKEPIYQNHFSAKREIYQDYVKNYLIPCMDVIEKDPEVNAEAMRDSNYSGLTRTNGDHLKSKLGISFYPLAPFLLERLFSVYCQNKRIKITYL